MDTVPAHRSWAPSDAVRLLIAAAAVRLALVAGSRAADTLSSDVAFTDVDYAVVTDGARYVASGRSPFQRATYRYPPLLAALLLPNVLLLAEWGKLLFCAADVLTGALLIRLLRRHARAPPREACARAAAFLLHPFAIAASTRGNADALVVLAVVGALSLLLDGRTVAAGAVFGLAVHLKLYPIIYAVPMALWLAQPPRAPPGGRCVPPRPAGVCAAGSRWCCAPGLLGDWRCYLARARYWYVVAFAASAALSLAAATAGSYAACGRDYLDHALLYHVGRSDPRHNFSPWWLPQYFARGAASPVESLYPPVSGTAAVVHRVLRWGPACATAPQLALVVLLGCAYGPTRLPLALFTQTLAFVAWNRVCTAQYYVWWAALLPLALPSDVASGRWGRTGGRAGAALAAAWVLTELGWAWPALQLELRGQAAWVCVWAASCAFFCANAGLLCGVLAHAGPPWDTW